MDVPTLAMQIRVLNKDEFIDLLHHVVYGHGQVSDNRLFEIGSEVIMMRDNG